MLLVPAPLLDLWSGLLNEAARGQSAAPAGHQATMAKVARAPRRWDGSANVEMSLDDLRNLSAECCAWLLCEAELADVAAPRVRHLRAQVLDFGENVDRLRAAVSRTCESGLGNA